MSLMSLKQNQYDLKNALEIQLDAQSEYFLPDWGECLVLSLGLKAVIDNLNHRERIALSSEVSGMKPLSLHDFDNKMPNVLHFEESVS